MWQRMSTSKGDWCDSFHCVLYPGLRAKRSVSLVFKNYLIITKSRWIKLFQCFGAATWSLIGRICGWVTFFLESRTSHPLSPLIGWSQLKTCSDWSSSSWETQWVMLYKILVTEMIQLHKHIVKLGNNLIMDLESLMVFKIISSV